MDNSQGSSPPGQSHRMVYFSLVCPEIAGRQVRAFQQWVYQHHNARAAMKSPAHITLIPPFWWPVEQLNTLSTHAAGFRFGIPTLRVRLDGFGHFGKRVLYVQVETTSELLALQGAFSMHMRVLAGQAMKRDDKPFHPHVTIATRDLAPAAFREAWDHFSRIDFRADLDLDAISMMLHSPGTWHIDQSFRWAA